MTSTAELIRKEEEALKKAKAATRAKIKKLEDAESKRVIKILRKTAFFETDFSDSDLLEGINKMIDWQKKKTSSQFISSGVNTNPAS